MGADRRNNFDALRLVAAVSVVFSHSFLIAEGTQDHEWLIRLTGNQSILGLVGVFVFFAVSGFLVTQSFEQTDDPWRFLVKRALRIFPGLFVATLLSAFVLAGELLPIPVRWVVHQPSISHQNELQHQSRPRPPGGVRAGYRHLEEPPLYRVCNALALDP